MVNAMYVKQISFPLPSGPASKTTEARCFVHPYAGTTDVEESTLKVLLARLGSQRLDARKTLRGMVGETQAKFPEVKVSIEVKENYQNMKEV